MAPPVSPAPFVLLDDARAEDARPARFYSGPEQVVVARRPEEIAPALERLAVLSARGLHLAGAMAYEAGLALEPRLASRAAVRTGAAGPLLWFGAFAGYEEIASAAVPAWLAARTQGEGASLGPLGPALSAAAYLAGFAEVRRAILAGDIYQANLTFPLVGGWHGDALALYAALRGASAAGHGGVVFDGSHWLLSLSPELFVALSGGRITVRPMKGTRPRAENPEADRAAARELASAAKDRAENLMILDLMRNDVSRVAQPGSVQVEAPFTVETIWCTVG